MVESADFYFRSARMGALSARDDVNIEQNLQDVPGAERFALFGELVNDAFKPHELSAASQVGGHF